MEHETATLSSSSPPGSPPLRSSSRTTRTTNVCCLPFYYMFGCCFIPNSLKNQNHRDGILLNNHSKHGHDTDDDEDDDDNDSTNGGTGVQQMEKLTWYRIKQQMKLTYGLSVPYFYENRKGCWTLFFILILNIGQVLLNVVFSYITKDFWNTLNDKDATGFYTVLVKYISVLAIASPIFTYYDYYQRILMLQMREFMTTRSYELYIHNQNYYKLERIQLLKVNNTNTTNETNDENIESDESTQQLQYPINTTPKENNKEDPDNKRMYETEKGIDTKSKTPPTTNQQQQQQPKNLHINNKQSQQPSQQNKKMVSNVIDNPDQRLTDDINSFTSYALTLLLIVLSSCFESIAFAYILYTIYPTLLYTCILYVVGGTMITTCLGQLLVNLNFQQSKYEATLRYHLVRLRDNCESIAFYHGEQQESYKIQCDIQNVMQNKKRIYQIQKNLEFFTNTYFLLIQIVPVAVVAPVYFRNEIGLGVISQSVGAFNRVLFKCSLLIEQFEELTTFSAGLERLSDFYEAIHYVNNNNNHNHNKGGGDNHGSDGSGHYHLLQRPVVMTNNTPPHVNNDSHHHTLFNHDDNHAEMGTFFDDANTMAPTASNANTNDGIGKMITVKQWQPLMYSNPPIPPTNIANTNITGTNVNIPVLDIQNVTIQTPGGQGHHHHHHQRTLVQNVNCILYQQEHLLITGPSGIGKSSLLRVIANLWDSGHGIIERPHDHDVYFLPQRPYCTIGTLKDQLLYPSSSTTDFDDDNNNNNQQQQQPYDTVVPCRMIHEHWSDEDLLHVLKQINLYDVAVRSDPKQKGNPIRGLYSKQDWTNQLSLGEQQRLAFGRLFIHQPTLVILDEATSALDVASETKMYNLLRNMKMNHNNNNNNNKKEEQNVSSSSPSEYHTRKEKLGVTYISVGHRPSIRKHHEKLLNLLPDGGYEFTTISNNNNNNNNNSGRYQTDDDDEDHHNSPGSSHY